MAWSFVASSNTGPGTAANVTVTKPAGVAEGHLLVALVYIEPLGEAVTPPSGWTLHQTQDGNASGNFTIRSYWKVAGASEPTTYTWTHASVYRQATIVAYSGGATTSPLDVDGSQASSAQSTSITAPSITTTQVDDLLVFWGATWDNTLTYTAPSGTPTFTERAGDSSHIDVSDAVFTSSGATGSKTATASAVAWNAAIMAAFKIAPSSTPITVADTIALGESIGITVTLQAAESLTLSDTPAVTVTAPIGEGLTTGETPALTVTLGVAGDLTLAEALSVATGGTPITVVEGLGLGEGIALSAQVGVAEGLSIAEALAALVQATVGDALAVTDLAAIVSHLTIADASLLGDGLVLAIAAPIGEDLGALDSLGGAVILGLMDTISTPEGVSVTTVGGLVITVSGPVRVTGGRGVRVTGGRGVRVTGGRGVRVTD